MKKYLIVIFAVSISLIGKSQCNCPDKGDSKQLRIQSLDSMKNREIDTNIVPTSVSLSDILADSNDLNRFSDGEYVCIEGYVIESKDGGLETANCHSKSQSDHDIHLVISSSQTNTDPKQAMICEITRKYRINNPSVGIRTYLGKHVKICGYLFHDVEHKQNAVDDNPTGTTLWRKTVVEVHPVCKIEIIE